MVDREALELLGQGKVVTNGQIEYRINESAVVEFRTCSSTRWVATPTLPDPSVQWKVVQERFEQITFEQAFDCPAVNLFYSYQSSDRAPIYTSNTLQTVFKLGTKFYRRIAQ